MSQGHRLRLFPLPVLSRLSVFGGCCYRSDVPRPVPLIGRMHEYVKVADDTAGAPTSTHKSPDDLG